MSTNLAKCISTSNKVSGKGNFDVIESNNQKQTSAKRSRRPVFIVSIRHCFTFAHRNFGLYSDVDLSMLMLFNRFSGRGGEDIL